MPSPTYSDENFDIKRKVKYYSFEQMHAVLGAAGASAGAHTGAPDTQEIGAIGLVGIVIGAAGDMINGLTLLPRDLDWTKDVGIRIAWESASATGTESASWIVLYDIMAEGTALIVGTTALDTAVALLDLTTATADALDVTDRGIIAANTFTEAQVVPGSTMISWNIECDAETITGDCMFLGMYLDYVPKRYKGEPSTYNPALTAEDGI